MFLFARLNVFKSNLNQSYYREHVLDSTKESVGNDVETELKQTNFNLMPKITVFNFDTL
jgi:hypothetical protein